MNSQGYIFRKLKFFFFAVVHILNLANVQHVFAQNALFLRPENQTQFTRDLGSTVEEILDYEKVNGACNRYFKVFDQVASKRIQPPANLQELKIYCGKDLFFNSVVDTYQAFPEVFLKKGPETWPEITGPSFEKLGFIPNPKDPGFPVGISKIRALNPLVRTALSGKTRTMACATCHVGQLPDGRYSVGMVNENLQLGTFNLVACYPIWAIDQKRNDPSIWGEKSIAYYNMLTERLKKSGQWKIQFPDLSGIPSWIPVSQSIFELIGLPRLTVEEMDSNFEDQPGIGNTFFLILGSRKKVFF